MADSNKKIKGITIEIGGNVSPLNKALNEVNKHSRDLQSELKEINKALQFDPKNTELLAQKQKVLQDVISETAKKLETLKEAQKQMAAQGKDDINSEAYRALQREISSTEGYLKSLEKQSDTSFDKIEDNVKTAASGVKVSWSGAFSGMRKVLTSALSGLGSAVAKAFSGIKDIAGKVFSAIGEAAKKAFQGIAELAGKAFDAMKSAASAAAKGIGIAMGTVGAGIAAGLGGAVKLADDAKGALNDFQAATGIADAEAKGFGETLKNIYANNFGEGFGDIAAAMTTVAQSTKDLDPSKIEQLTANALMFRDTFGFDVQEQMRAVNMLIDQFGLSGDEAFNLIAQGAQNGLDKNGDLLDSINEYSVHFKQLGMNAEQMFNSFANGAASGTFSVDKLGDAVKEFGIRIVDGSDSTIGALQSIGLVAEDNSKSVAKQTKNLESTGKKIEELENKIKYATIQQGEFNEKTSELTKIKTEDNLKKWNEELSELKSELASGEAALASMNSETNSGKQSWEELAAQFRAGGDQAGAALQTVVDGLFAMEDPVQRNMAGVALFGTMWEDLGEEGIRALSDLNGEISLTNDALSEINKVKYDTLGEAFTGLKRILQTEFILPIGEQALPMFRDFVTELSDGAKTADGDLTTFSSTIGSAFAGLLTDLTGFLPQIAGMLSEFVSGLISGIQANLPEITRSIAVLITALFQLVIQAMPQLLQLGMQLLAQLGQGIAQQLPEIAVIVSQTIAELANMFVINFPLLTDAAIQIIDALIQGLTVAMPAISAAIPQIIQSITVALTMGLPQIIQVGVQLLSGLISAIPPIISELSAQLPQIITAITDVIIQGLPELLEAGVSIITELAKGITQALPALADALPTVLNAIVEAITQNLPIIIEASVAIISALVTGLTSALPQLVPAVVEIVSGIVNIITQNLPLLIEAALQIIQSLSQGIVKALPQLLPSVVESIKAIVTTIMDNLDLIINASIEIIIALAEGLIKATPQLVEKIPEIISKLISAISKCLPELIEAGVQIIGAVIEGLAKNTGQIIRAGQDVMDALFKAIGEIDWFEIGKNIIIGIGDGLLRNAARLYVDFQNAIGGVVDDIKSFLGINSPSKLMADLIGKNMALGIGVGFEKDSKTMLSEIENSLDGVRGLAVPTIPISMGPVMKPEGANLFSGISQPKGLNFSAASQAASITVKIANFNNYTSDSPKQIGEIIYNEFQNLQSRKDAPWK